MVKKIVLFIVILLTAFIPNFSNAAKVSVPKVSGVNVVEQKTNQAKVKWKKESKASGYRVYLYDYTSKKYKYYGETTSTYMTIKKLKTAATYKVKIRAYKKSGKKRYYGSYSGEQQFVTAPSAVSGTKVTDRTNNSLTIKWNNVTRAKGYEIYVKKASDKSLKYYGSTTKNTLTIKNLNYAEKYTIAVKSYKTLNGKRYCTPSYKAITTVTLPNRLSNVKIKNDSKSTITISWSKLARVTGYRVYQYNPSIKKWDMIATTTSTSVKVKNLKLGIEYKYRVKAYLVYNKVTYNGTLTVVSDMIYVGKPKNLEVTYIKGDTKKIKWDKVEKATGYKVYLYDETAQTEKLYTTTKETNATLTKLGASKYYRIYVKAYAVVNGKTLYGDSSIIRTGIDVSKWQEDIDWAKVRKTGINFAMIRCGYSGDTTGKIYEDAYFKKNIQEAIANGIEVGVYIYSYAINEEEAYNEAEWIVGKLKEYGIGKKCKYIAYDFEVYKDKGTRTEKITKEQLDSNCIEFLNYVYNEGYKPVLYGNKNYLTNIFDTEEIVNNTPDCLVWLAQYNTAPSYEGEYLMWQYTSSERVDGISERVDVNVLYF